MRSSPDTLDYSGARPPPPVGLWICLCLLFGGWLLIPLPVVLLLVRMVLDGMSPFGEPMIRNGIIGGGITYLIASCSFGGFILLLMRQPTRLTAKALAAFCGGIAALGLLIMVVWLGDMLLGGGFETEHFTGLAGLAYSVVGGVAAIKSWRWAARLPHGV